LFLRQFSERCFKIPTPFLCYIDYIWPQVVLFWAAEGVWGFGSLNMYLKSCSLDKCSSLSECLILICILCLMHVWCMLFWLSMLPETTKKTWKKEGRGFIWKVQSPELYFICTKLVVCINYVLHSSHLYQRIFLRSNSMVYDLKFCVISCWYWSLLFISIK
jgi:hypothetical protein